MTTIEDVKGFSFRNFDNRKSKELNEAVLNHFPFRIGSVLVVNAGAIIRFLLKFAKFLGVKKKIIKRVKNIVFS